MDRLEGQGVAGAGFFTRSLEGRAPQGQNNPGSPGLMARISGLFRGRRPQVAQAPLAVVAIAGNSHQSLTSRVNALSANRVESDNTYEMPENIQQMQSPMYESIDFLNGDGSSSSDDGYVYIEPGDESDFLRSEGIRRQREYEMPEDVSRSHYSLSPRERVIYLLPLAEPPRQSLYEQIERVRQIDGEGSSQLEESGDLPLYIEHEYNHQTGRIMECGYHADRRVYFEHQPMESGRSSPSEGMFADPPLNAFAPLPRGDLSFDEESIVFVQERPGMRGFQPAPELTASYCPDSADSGLGNSPPRPDLDFE